MKRRDLVGHLREAGCILHREGSNHSIFFNPVNGRLAAVPRHREIENVLAGKICRQLGISPPKDKS